MSNERNKIIYQLALRTFTPEGTLNAAKELLPHIASLGVDVVYICPFYVAENDSDRAAWSVRQIDSNVNNPKNPYKIADYFNVDPEYGTNQDLKAFVDEAHKNNLLVMFDLVYLHCGKAAVFVKEHPDFIERNEDGSIRVPDRWPFARLNYESADLRQYLKKNMQVLMCDYGCDWFRCDVGDSVPLDFWDEAFSYLKSINRSLITLNEGIDPEYIKNVFDMGYNFDWNTLMIDIFANNKPAYELKKSYEEECEKYSENIFKLIRTIDTHDVASDCGLNRNEIIMTSRGVEAALVITNTYDGVAFMWNGYEVCDNNENNMFSNRIYGRRNNINWSRAFTSDGKRRMEFIKNIHKLHKENEAIINGKIIWVDNNSPDEIVSYIKKSDNSKVLVVVNTKNKAVNVKLEEELNISELLLSSGCIVNTEINMEAYGYLVAQIL